MKLKQAIITFWFRELEYNPICRINDLEDALVNYFNRPFLINNQEPFSYIGMPRIIANNENDYTFNMCLVNANLIINLHECNDYDEVNLKINELMQVVFDSLMKVYELDIIYSSIKIELFEIIKDKKSVQESLLISDENYEDFLLKNSICKDNKYYINKTVSVVKEVKVDIKLPNNIQLNNDDIMIRSMLVSLKGNMGIDINNKVIEINDRLSYNNDDKYLVKKDNIRDLLFEFREILKKELVK